MDNLILATDSYKVSHKAQYPKDTKRVFSYFESRGSKIGATHTQFFGLQYIIKKHLLGQVITQDKIDEAEDVCNLHLGNGLFNRAGWEYILKVHNGRLPIQIKAVPEGRIVPTSNALMTVVNTDPECFWLTNYLETLLVQVWYPTTIASMGLLNKRAITEALKTSGFDSPQFKLHDFGVRGTACLEGASIGGAAHLVNFSGTDNLPALMLLRKYYDTKCAGFSIPASEHSTITSWGKEHEVDAMRNMLEQYPTGLVACVSDSFNIYKACSDIWGTVLKDKIMSRDGCLVIRPDSGDARQTIPTCLQILWDKFGGTVNEKGFKTLDKHVRIIQGDGVDLESMKKIYEILLWGGWSADNIVFGSGGALLQKVDRETFKFAFKCSAIQRGQEWHDVFKQPIDEPFKKSKAGRLRLVKCGNGDYVTSRYDNLASLDNINQLETVFYNGDLTKSFNLDDVKSNAC